MRKSPLGKTWPDPNEQLFPMLKFGFRRFDNLLGVKGLAKEGHGRLEILAVETSQPGTGQFAFFMVACMTHYREIVVYHDMSGIGSYLKRIGFKPFGEDHWKWMKKKI